MGSLTAFLSETAAATEAPATEAPAEPAAETEAPKEEKVNILFPTCDCDVR